MKEKYLILDFINLVTILCWIQIKDIFELIQKSCNSDPNILKWKIGPVQYVDVNKHNGEWDVFHKPKHINIKMNYE